MLFVIQFRNGVHVCKRITLVAQQGTDLFCRPGNPFSREHVTGINIDQRKYLFWRNDKVTGKGHDLDLVLLTLNDVYRYIDIFLVRRNGDLRGIDLELEITAIKIMGAQNLEVGRQRLF